MKTKMNTHLFIRHLQDEYKDSILLPDLAKHADDLFRMTRYCFDLQKEKARKNKQKQFVFMGIWRCLVQSKSDLCLMSPDNTTRLMCQRINENPDDGFTRLINIIAKPPMYLDYLESVQSKALSKPALHPVVMQYKPDLSTLFQLVFVSLFDLMLRQGVEEFVADGLGVFNLVNIKHGKAINLTLE